MTNRARYTLENKWNHSPYSIDPNMKITYVPHCVYAYKGDSEYFKKKYKLPNNLRIIGRIGGFNQFDDISAISAVIELLNSTDYFFCFVNTKKFVDHPKIRYIDYISTQEKWDFYAACDVFLNGRIQGESFGFSIVEPLMIGKSIIAPDLQINLRMDQNHIRVLREDKFLYKDKNDLIDKIRFNLDNPTDSTNLIEKVSEFYPEKVADKFYKTFLIN
jgi:glycosyltransferase involved in cell wall biosynthesis